MVREEEKVLSGAKEFYIYMRSSKLHFIIILVLDSEPSRRGIIKKPNRAEIIEADLKKEEEEF